MPRPFDNPIEPRVTPRGQRLCRAARALTAGLLFATLCASALCLGGEARLEAQEAPPGASVSVKVSVPAALRSSPFDVDRYLNLPPNFSVSVLARVPGARFMAVAPNNDILVSVPGAGKIVLVRPQASGTPLVSNFATGLRNPHDIVFHAMGGTTYVYVAESNQINRFVYNVGDTSARDREIVVANLPDSSSAELGGFYGHQLKNIALDPNHKLYVSIASATNASPSDTTSNPVRSAVYQYNADGSGGRIFARGLRNAEGLALVPGTNDLWVTVNNRDNIAYPFHKDFDGDGSDDYGKVMPAYVDNHPPDEFTRVTDGANYGWPFANPDPDGGVDNMPFNFDAENNAGGSLFPLESFTRISKGLPAHSAPLGLSFLQSSSFAPAYRNGAVIALHGSWNRSRKAGYKVIFFPWSGTPGESGDQLDLVTGWLDPAAQYVWGRPVDAVPDNEGGLLISDDHAGAIYRLKYLQATPSASSWAAWDIASRDNTMRTLWSSADARAALWTHASGGAMQSSLFYGPYAGWTARQIALGDDAKMRVLWTHADGRASLWRVEADGSLDFNFDFGPYPGWSATDLAVGGDGKARLLWSHPDGRASLWRVGESGKIESDDSYGPYANWSAKSLAVGEDNKLRVLWSHRDGRAAFWTVKPDRSLEVNVTYGPYTNWTPLGIAAGADNKTRVLWSHGDGRAALWTMSTDGLSLEANLTYGPYANWTPRSLAVGADNKTRVLWSHSDGRSALWRVGADGKLEVDSTHGPVPE